MIMWPSVPCFILRAATQSQSQDSETTAASGSIMWTEFQDELRRSPTAGCEEPSWTTENIYFRIRALIVSNSPYSIRLLLVLPLKQKKNPHVGASPLQCPKSDVYINEVNFVRSILKVKKCNRNYHTWVFFWSKLFIATKRNSLKGFVKKSLNSSLQPNSSNLILAK